MQKSHKLLTTALAAIMLVSSLAVSTPASAWSRWGWGGGWGGRHWGYGGWGRHWGYGGYGAWGLGAGLATGLALGAGYPYGGYGYWGSAYPGYGSWGSAGCGAYGAAYPTYSYPAYYGYSGGCSCSC